MAKERPDERFPEVVIKPNVLVLGGSGWRVYARPDFPEECCVLERFADQRLYFGRDDIARIVSMLSAFNKALDETYETRIAKRES